MEELIEFSKNDTTRAIEDVADNLREWQSPLCNERIRAIILTHLQEAAMMSLLLVDRSVLEAK